MTLKTIIKKLSVEPEKFGKLKIKIVHSDGEEKILYAECSNDPHTVWRAYDDAIPAPISVFGLIRNLRNLSEDKNRKAEILQWQELSDEEAYN